MSSTKEKSAVGVGAPATESDNNTTESIIDISEKIKSYSENITAILDSLSKTLRLTDAGKNIVSIVPVTVPKGNMEYVGIAARVTYKNGHMKDIDIDCDSGIAAVFDVAKCLCY